MGSKQRAGGRYVIPIDSNGAEVAQDAGRGMYTLVPGTYHYILGGANSPVHSFHLTGYTAASTITSATPQDCNHSDLDVPDHDATVGEWMTEDPPDAYVSVDGTGWTATLSVVAASGAGIGGAMWHFSDTGSHRTRVTLVVGVTGIYRGSAWGKG